MVVLFDIVASPFRALKSPESSTRKLNLSEWMVDYSIVKRNAKHTIWSQWYKNFALDAKKQLKNYSRRYLFTRKRYKKNVSYKCFWSFSNIYYIDIFPIIVMFIIFASMYYIQTLRFFKRIDTLIILLNYFLCNNQNLKQLLSNIDFFAYDFAKFIGE